MATTLDHARPRRYPRADHTADLHAAVRPRRAAPRGVAIRDLSIGGIAIEPAHGLRPDDHVRFEFWGPSFAWSGTARVAHADGERAGLAFESWDGPAHRPLQRLLRDRLVG